MHRKNRSRFSRISTPDINIKILVVVVAAACFCLVSLFLFCFGRISNRNWKLNFFKRQFIYKQSDYEMRFITCVFFQHFIFDQQISRRPCVVSLFCVSLSLSLSIHLSISLSIHLFLATMCNFFWSALDRRMPEILCFHSMNYIIQWVKESTKKGQQTNSANKLTTKCTKKKVNQLIEPIRRLFESSNDIICNVINGNFFFICSEMGPSIEGLLIHLSEE